MHLINDNTQAHPQLPMTDAQLKAWETGRDLDAELLESVTGRHLVRPKRNPGSSHRR